MKAFYTALPFTQMGVFLPLHMEPGYVHPLLLQA